MSDDLLIKDLKPDKEKLWKGAGMPAFDMEDLQSWQSLQVHFATMGDRDAFAKLIGQRITHKTRSLWYPRAEIGHFGGKSWVSSFQITPRYPIYIISKGRWKSRATSKALERMKIQYHIVVEPQEYDNYAAVIDPKKILKLPFSNLGKGSIPARNWVWKHAKGRGAFRHWILDDNIEGFFRLTDNLKVPVGDGSTFRAAEDFTDRFTNVAISGMNYFMFAPRKSGDVEAFTLNTRIYSCILIRNDLTQTIEDTDGERAKVPLRWRGRYNEDTDLCLRALKEGWCTVLFNAFLAFKTTTMTSKGGNTEALYKTNAEMINPQEAIYSGRREMAESLKAQHPEIVKITHKWGRWQHHVDYSGFRQKLREKPNIEKEKMDNNYGMEMKIRAEKHQRNLDIIKKQKRLTA